MAYVITENENGTTCTTQEASSNLATATNCLAAKIIFHLLCVTKAFTQTTLSVWKVIKPNLDNILLSTRFWKIVPRISILITIAPWELEAFLPACKICMSSKHFFPAQQRSKLPLSSPVCRECLRIWVSYGLKVSG